MEVKDLSLVHELISDLFHWPKREADWDEYRLSSDQIDFLIKMVGRRKYPCLIASKSINSAVN